MFNTRVEMRAGEGEAVTIVEYNSPDLLNVTAQAANRMLWHRRHAAAHGFKTPVRFLIVIEEVDDVNP